MLEDILKAMNIDVHTLQQILLLLGVGGIGTAIMLSIIDLKKGKTKGKIRKNSKYDFCLETSRGDIHFYNPFTNFLVYGGAGSGKTDSIGKPLLAEYIKHGFSGMVYDFKDFDLTLATKTLTEIYFIETYKPKVYTVSFTELNNTNRFNPIKPSVINDEMIFMQLMNDLIDNYASDRNSTWYSGARGIFKGVALRFYRSYPDICTIPHIVNFICSSGKERIISFLQGDTDARKQASAFIDSISSEKTAASYFSNLTNYLADLSVNKKISYVLSGDEFDFNLIDPEDPKLLCLCNSNQVQSLISPLIGLMVTLSARKFTIENKVPFFYMLDEATTFKIPDFESMPSVLREYLCSFTLLTQSPSKIEKMYGSHDRASIEANFANQFFGRTKDRLALQNFIYLFGKEKRIAVSKSKGQTSSGGTSTGLTESEKSEEKYNIEFFTNLCPGEFIGSASESNITDFQRQFQRYKYREKENRDMLKIRGVSDSIIERNYIKIMEDLNRI